MTTHYSRRVENELKSLETALTQLDKAKPGEVPKFTKNAEVEARKVQSDLNSLSEAALELTLDANKTEVRVKIDAFKEKLSRLNVELDFKCKAKNESALFGRCEAPEPRKEGQVPGSLDEGNAMVQQYIRRGDFAYDEAVNAMERGLGLVESSKQVVGAVEGELQQQDVQIDRIHDKTEDIRSNLKLANKIMSYIHRRFLTDKLILCLIIVIVIVILFLIIYGAAGLGSSSALNTPSDSLN
jgi:t-SNARE complex subunit (syntaxin)